jgi:hypothetical protein
LFGKLLNHGYKISKVILWSPSWVGWFLCNSSVSAGYRHVNNSIMLSLLPWLVVWIRIRGRCHLYGKQCQPFLNSFPVYVAVRAFLAFCSFALFSFIKRQELVTLRKHPSSPTVFGGVRVAHLFSFLCCVLCTEMVSVSLDFPFFIGPSVFSNVCIAVLFCIRINLSL